MNPAAGKHGEWSALRARAFADLFGDEPEVVFPHRGFDNNPDDPYPIDVLVFALETRIGPAVAAVTSGMSDRRMIDVDGPGGWARRELIQYFRRCTGGHARRLRDMAWLPLFDGFFLDAHHSVAWRHAAVEGTPWRAAFFLEPIVRSHREFRLQVDGDEASLLWHVPISDEERAYKNEHGSDALLARMGEVDLPWIFDEDDRPPLVG